MTSDDTPTHDIETLAEWLLRVTRYKPWILGPVRPDDPAEGVLRPTASHYQARADAIAREGGSLRAIEGSGRPPEVDEDIARHLETRPQLPESRKHLDFEDGSWSALTGRQMFGTVGTQNKVVRSGTQALQIGLEHGNKKLRAQLRDNYNAPFDQETWYSFSVLLPASFNPTESVVLAQWCDQAPFGAPSGKPPMSIRYQNGQLRFKAAHDDTPSDDPKNQLELTRIKNIQKDDWLNFEVKTIWRQSGEADVEFYLNGKKVSEYSGKLGYPGREEGPYFMFGLKTEKIKEGEPLTAFFDSYSRGQTRDDVALAPQRPANSSA